MTWEHNWYVKVRCNGRWSTYSGPYSSESNAEYYRGQAYCGGNFETAIYRGRKLWKHYKALTLVNDQSAQPETP